MPTYETKDGKVRIKNVPLELLQDDIMRKALGENVRRAAGDGEYNFLDVQGIASEEAKRVSEETPGSLAPTQQQKEEIMFQPPEPEEPTTTAKGILDSFIQEAGPMSAVAGLSLLATGATGATVFGLGAKGAEFLNEKLGFEEGEGIADPLAAGRKFLESIGFDEDPDTMWERIAAGAGVGVDEAITAILSGNVLKAVGTGIQGLKNIPKIGQKIGGLAQKAGTLFSEKAGTQIVGGIGGGAGAQGGAEFAEYKDLGPVMSTVATLGGAVLGDITTTQLANIAGKVQDLARATGRSVPEAAQEIIDKAKNEGIDIVLSDIKPQDLVAETKRNVREMLPGGTARVRHDVQTPQRRRALENIANKYGVDINDPNVDKHLSNTADEFFAQRDSQLTAFTSERDRVFKNVQSQGASEVDVSKTVDLIDSEVNRIANLGDKLYKPVREGVPKWKIAIDNGDSVFLREEAKKLISSDLPQFNNAASKLVDWANAIDEGRNLTFINRELEEVLTSGENSYKPVIDELLKRKHEIEGKDLTQIESLRESLGGKFSDPSLQNIRTEGDKVINSVYSSLREDMGTHVRNVVGEQGFHDFEEAMSGLSTLSDDFDSTVLSSLMKI